MRYEFNFGKLGSKPPQRQGRAPGTFRLAVLGDFSGRANRGELETGADLARRKPIRLDVDTIEEVIQRFGTVLRLPIGVDGGSLELRPTSVEDLHPDALYENLELFSELAGLRQKLDHSRTFQAAVAEVRSWLPGGGETVARPVSTRARASAVRVDAKLSDFARLIGRPTVAAVEATPADDLVRQVVAPYVVEADDPDQEALIGAVDQALSAAMRSVLHHPDFQSLEAAWRSLDFLVRRVETSARLQLVLYDLSAEELAADLSATDAMEATGLYQLLVEQPALDAHQGPLSAVIGNYTFEMTPPHAELLGRMARIVAQARAPFIAAIGSDCITTKTEDLHPLVVEAWGALRRLPEAYFVGLAVPRFLLRTPYGAKIEPIDPFEFEEFDAKTGLKALLWGNPAVLVGVLLAEHFNQQGAKMPLGKVLSLGDMAYFFYHDEDGEPIALPCTERLLTERKAVHVAAQNLMAVLAIKGRPEVRLAGFRSLAGTELAGPWTPPEQIQTRLMVAKPEPEPVPEVEEEASMQGEEAAEAPAEGGDADLDTLLAELGGGEPQASGGEAVEAPAEGAAGEAPSDTGSAELDTLLADLAAGSASAAGDEDMDPELAALLKDL